MAYNYDEFMKAASAAGMLDRFSEADLGAAKSNPEFGYSILQMYQNRDKATTAEQRLLADETANQLRKSYGVTPASGADGLFDAMNATTGTTKSKTSGENNAVAKIAIGSGPAFNYDPEKDPRMAAYRKTYLREAERAREDTLAKAAAATGGIPSSYAVGAADQAGNYFVSQLTDKIPELYNDAYNQYRQMENDAYNRQLQEWEKAMSIYQILGNNAPKEYLDILGIKKKKKTDSGTPTTGYRPKAETPETETEVPTPDEGTDALTKAEKAKLIRQAALRKEITPNQAQALLKQL